MKRLLTLDTEDYTPEMPVRVKYSTRAVIVREGRLATQHGAEGDYKLLGGGVEPGESAREALCREVREESGLIVIVDSIREIGEIVERRRDLFEPEEIFERHSIVFACEVKPEMAETRMTASEIARGYHLCWAAPEEIIAGNAPFCEKQPWSLRDCETVKLLLESGELKL